MKKILLATTILSMSAGFAAAEVKTSGDARMGLKSTGSVSTAGVSSTASTLDSRVRISFSGTGATDGGLAFGGSIRADNAGTGASGTSGSAFISGAFGKLSMGDVASADNAAAGNIASVGYDGAGYSNSVGYSADGGGDEGLPGTYANTVRDAKVMYTYTVGDLTLTAGAGQMSTTPANSYSVGAKYVSGGVTIGVGYGNASGGTISGLRAYDTTIGTAITATTGDAGTAANSAGMATAQTISNASATDLTLSASYVMADTTVKAIYQVRKFEGSAAARALAAGTAATVVRGSAAIDLSSTASTMGLSVVQKMGALSLTGFAISTALDADSDLSASNPTVSRSGVGFGYDLGGGASISGGWASADTVVHTAVASTTQNELERNTLTTVSAATYDLGVNFSF